MQIYFRTARLASVSGLVLSLVLGGTVRAYADVKIESEIHVTGTPSALIPGGRGRRGQRDANPNAARPSSTSDETSTEAPGSIDSTNKVTTYFKGTKARREASTNRVVTLYDAAAKQVTFLNMEDKTFCTVSEKVATKLQFGPLNLPNPALVQSLPPGFSIDTSLEADPTGLVQSTLGKTTRKFSVYGAMRLIRQQQSMGGIGSSGGIGGHRRGSPGGGDTGGGGNQGGGGAGGSVAGGQPIPSTGFDGEYWMADATILPSGARSPLLPLLFQTVPDGFVLPPLYGKVGHTKQIPLASKMTFVTASVDLSTDLSSRPTLVIEMQVKSIQDGPLDDKLFKIPDDFQKVGTDAILHQVPANK